MRDLPRGTVTFLFTDVEGSTRLLKELREGYGEVLADHQRLLRTAFEDAGGQEIDTQGDSFFVAFRRAKDAVNAAVAAQRALAAHRWPKGGAVRVRMGLHTGEPAVGDERYVGMGVHRAARIAAAAHGGQILLSNTTRGLVEDELPRDTRLVDLGEHKLKDIDLPERIFQLMPRDCRTAFRPCGSRRRSHARVYGGAPLEFRASGHCLRLQRAFCSPRRSSASRSRWVDTKRNQPQARALRAIRHGDRRRRGVIRTTSSPGRRSERSSWV
jgi:class 3 adenylate cyclase